MVVVGAVVVAAGLVGGGYPAWRSSSGHSTVAQVRELRLEPDLQFRGDVVVGGWVMTTYTSERPAGRVEAFVRDRLRAAGYEVTDGPETLTAYAFDGGIVPDGFPPEEALDGGTSLTASRAGDGRRLHILVGTGSPIWVELSPQL